MNYTLKFFFFLLLTLVYSISPFAQPIDNGYKKIYKLQEQSLYDSALKVANQLLADINVNEDDRQTIILSKAISFFYVSKFDSLQNCISLLKGKVFKGDSNYPIFLFAKALVASKEGEYKTAISILLESLEILENSKEQTFLPNIYNSICQLPFFSGHLKVKNLSSPPVVFSAL